MTTFGQIKIGEWFLYRGKRWKRIRGIFAMTETELDLGGQVGWSFDVKTIVEKV